MPLMNNRDGFISQYISLCVGAILYGAFLALIPRSIRAFIRQGRGKWWIHVIAAILFVLVTLDISLLIARMGLTVQHCFMCGPAHGGSCDPIPWFNRAKTFIVAFSTLLTEGAMIYRCWLVYFNSWIVIAVPLLLWLHGLGMMIYTTSVQNNSGGYSGGTPEVNAAVQICFWVVTIVMKLMTTALIVRQLRIYKEPRTSIDEACLKIRTTTPHKSIVKSIVESGLMCTIASLFVLASLFCQQISLLAPTVMTIVSGISFNLMSIRVDQYKRKKEQKECVQASMAPSKLSFSTRSLFYPPKAHLKPEP